MNNYPNVERPNHSVFELIREGMHVHDSGDHHIGSVRRVYFGEDAGSTQPYSGGAATAPDPSLTGNNVIDDVLRGIFGDDDLPETLRARLVNNGFIQLDSSGLLASDRYVLREQIAGVSGDTVHLNVTRDELIKR